MVKSLMLIFLIIIGSSLVVADTSVTTNGITFQFDSDYQVGRFVDGEPWVIESSAGAGVTITAITPGFSNGFHGWEVNRRRQNLTQTSLDDRIGPSFIIPSNLPRNYKSNSSILKVISYDTGSSGCNRESSTKTCLKEASVLTILNKVPAVNTFRPPYFGTEKPLLSADLNLDLLPDLPLLTLQESLADVEAIFGGGVWLDHIEGSRNRYGHPADAMRTVGGNNAAEYGTKMSLSITSAMLRTMQTATDGEKRNLVNRIVQFGIDLFYMAKNGKTWPANGGIHAGRKGVILYAGYLLNNAEMLNIGYSHPGNIFQEDGFHYIGTNGEALWGEDCPDGRYEYHITSGSGGKACRDPKGLVDGGRCASGPFCNQAAGAPGIAQPTLNEQRSAVLYASALYQDYTSQYYGSGTVARLLGLEDQWNHAPYFEYLDRLASPPWNYHCGGYCSNYLTLMFKVYGKTNTPTLVQTVESKIESSSGFEIIMRPFSNVIKVPVTSNGQRISLYDIKGSQIAVGKIKNQQVAGMGFSNILPGVYFLQIGQEETLYKIIIL